jgi:hypothetical protein
MPIVIQCPICSAKFRAPDHAAGKVVACGKCGGQIRVPGGTAGAAAAKPAAPPIDFSAVVESEESARRRAFEVPEVRVEADEPPPHGIGLWLAIGGVLILLALAALTIMLLVNSGVFAGRRSAGNALSRAAARPALADAPLASPHARAL